MRKKFHHTRFSIGVGLVIEFSSVNINWTIGNRSAPLGSMTALSKFARSAFRMPPTTTATRVLGIHAADGPGRRRTTTIFRRKTVLQRAFCSALRTATAELQTSLHTPDAVFLEDEVMKLKAKGDHHAEKNASETMESKAVSTEAKQKIYDMAGAIGRCNRFRCVHSTLSVCTFSVPQ